ncbi:(2Fe-2S) ferredoxin domain-containing protein [Leisingera sp.]|uniref:(2Fe-2S) ferredoxin domain-containing protein n=1 Tax=Leisingera sp. TaxID=1879318 RepID=UPI002B26CE1E|nr:(2Fe-2S) ferredoxin domain-containing protein [Leisingera sp.]
MTLASSCEEAREHGNSTGARSSAARAVLYLVSAQYVSQARFGALACGLLEHAPCRAEVIRLEAKGPGLWEALDTLCNAGAQHIELYPIGLPFSQSLERWLPKAAGAWLARRDGDLPELFFAAPVQGDAALLQRAAQPDVQLTPIAVCPSGEKGKGWDKPPSFRHHLLVCTGPRCHLQDAPSLVGMLKLEVARAGLSAECLVTSTGCQFPCNRGPSLIHYPEGHWYQLPNVDAVRDFVSRALVAGEILHEHHFFTSGD